MYCLNTGIITFALHRTAPHIVVVVYTNRHRAHPRIVAFVFTFHYREKRPRRHDDVQSPSPPSLITSTEHNGHQPTIIIVSPCRRANQRLRFAILGNFVKIGRIYNAGHRCRPNTQLYKTNTQVDTPKIRWRTQSIVCFHAYFHFANGRTQSAIRHAVQIIEFNSRLNDTLCGRTRACKLRSQFHIGRSTKCQATLELGVCVSIVCTGVREYFRYLHWTVNQGSEGNIETNMTTETVALSVSVSSCRAFTVLNFC